MTEAPSHETSPRPADLRGISSWTRGERRLLVAVIVVAAAARLLCFQGLMLFDSLNYAGASMRILDDGIGALFRDGVAFHQTNRLGMTVPAAGVMALFGRSEFGAILWFLLLAALEMALVPRLLARILPARVVIAATALYFLMPAAIRGATSNGADIAMSVWTNIGLLLMLTAPAGRATAACVGGGLLVGIGALHKETALVLLPVALPVAALAGGATRAERMRTVLAFLGGLAIPLGVEAIGFAAWTGDPLFRYRSIEATHVPTVGAMAEVGRLDHYLRFWPVNLLRSPCELGALVFLIPTVLVVHAADRFRSGARLFAWWAAFAIGYAMFGTTSRTGWAPLLPCPRYLHYGLLPAAVLAAQVVTRAVPWPSSFAARAVAAGLAAVVGTASLTITLTGAETAASAAAAVFLVGIALRGGRDTAKTCVIAVAIVPAVMCAQRIRGDTLPALVPARRAVEFFEERYIDRVWATGQAHAALRTLQGFGRAPNVDLVLASRADLLALPDATGEERIQSMLLVSDLDAAALVATGRFVELERFAYRTDIHDTPWNLHVVVREAEVWSEPSK